MSQVRAEADLGGHPIGEPGDGSFIGTSLADHSPGSLLAAAIRDGGDSARPTAPLAASFPLAAERPRYMVRHLLKTRTVPGDGWTYLREPLRGTPESGDHYESTPESGFATEAAHADTTLISAELEVPREVVDDLDLLAMVVDHRLIVRLCTVENDALLNGTADGALTGIRTLGGAREEAGGDVVEVVARTCATVEETGGSCDGIVTHPRVYWRVVAAGRLPLLEGAGMKVSRTRMVGPNELLFADFRATFTLLDTTDQTVSVAPVPGREGRMLLTASSRIGLAMHLPQHLVTVDLEETP